MVEKRLRRFARICRALPLLIVAAAGALGTAAQASQPALAHVIVREAATDPVIGDWYEATGYRPLWTGPDDAARRKAFLHAIERAADHALPVARYDAAGLRAALRDARTWGDLGRVEVAMTRAYLAWAHDLAGGALDPRAIDPTIVREITRPAPRELLHRIATGDPTVVLRDLVPDSAAYVALMKARLDLGQTLRAGGWGAEVASGPLHPGNEGAAVVRLRNRLNAMGYGTNGVTRRLDRRLAGAVRAFQRDHGIAPSGIAGARTLAEIDMPPEERLRALAVAIERERWMRIDRSGRLIWVNLPDMSAAILDDGMTVFRTRSVIGRGDMDRRTPEFSDRMQYAVVNPSWSVPRSIVVKEYLPQLRNNPNAVSHLQVIDRNGRVVPRGMVNFAAYGPRSFPFAMRQPPGAGNALGRVKFMFPNKYNIYLHDTPAKSLFQQQDRARSHGCIRLAEPFDFAHVLFRGDAAFTTDDFDRRLATGHESAIHLDAAVPIHIVYFTAYPGPDGRIDYRPDVYDRDRLLWRALEDVGVALFPQSG